MEELKMHNESFYDYDGIDKVLSFCPIKSPDTRLDIDFINEGIIKYDYKNYQKFDDSHQISETVLFEKVINFGYHEYCKEDTFEKEVYEYFDEFSRNRFPNLLRTT